MRKALILSAGALASCQVHHYQADYGIRLIGEVPIICHAAIVDQSVNGDIITGRLETFCNNSTGYKVYAEPTDASLQVSVDGILLSRQPDGYYLLTGAPTATKSNHSISIIGAPGATLNIMIVMQ